MNQKTRKKLDKLIRKIRLNVNDIENRISKGQSVHMQRIAEIEWYVKKLDKILWKAQRIT